MRAESYFMFSLLAFFREERGEALGGWSFGEEGDQKEKKGAAEGCRKRRFAFEFFVCKNETTRGPHLGL